MSGGDGWLVILQCKKIIIYYLKTAEIEQSCWEGGIKGSLFGFLSLALHAALFSEAIHSHILCAHSLWAPDTPIKSYTCHGQTPIPQMVTFNTLKSSGEYLCPENQHNMAAVHKRLNC